MNSNQGIILEISGKPVTHSYGILAPTFWGRSVLSLYDNKVVEKTKKLIATRHCEVLLTEIDSVEISEDGIPFLLVLGILTIAFFGIGLIFFVLYFFMKYKYILIRSGSNVQVLSISNARELEQARNFMYSILAQAEKVKVSSR